ncbi:MAG: Enterobactin exporter EntS [Candidatus Moanabacter tarae]|uniref:Enterobactin exporter EntS n=1 Tax=Candidatus Moanibacter tarae TaxID=2200854 RepID=A0A2Z4AGA6_9BACT|nr:MAG: Enterobactin exporter EntS [Candidatus Moanabacter tarae]|tara:strand:+ start:48113 stop:49267 length:1155 start_codon:yes stop_codon:yes gene_type:complete
MDFLAVGWITLELTNSPFLVALVKFFRMIPAVLIGSLSGVIIDRFGRRRVILLAQCTQCGVAFAMALFFWTGKAAYWQLAVAAFILGSAWAIDFPARRSLVPDLVGKERTSDAIILGAIATNGARVLGPLAGGLIIQYYGPLGCFLFLSFVWLLPLYFLRKLPKDTIQGGSMSSENSPWKQLMEGFDYARRNQVILAVLLITITMNSLGFPFMTLLPVFARDVFKVEAAGFGFIGMASGLGSLPGILIVYRLKAIIPGGMIYAVGTFGFTLGIFLFALSKSFSISFAMLFIAGIGHSCFGVMQSSLMLTLSSDDMRSRAMGLVVLAIGVSPFGNLLVGTLASEYGAPFAVKLSASLAAFFLILIVLMFPQIWRAGNLNMRKLES